MELTNLTTKDVFLPIGTKVGVTVPASGTKVIDDSFRSDPAVLSAITASLLSVTGFDKADAGGAVVQAELATVLVPLVAAVGPTVVAHGLGYRPHVTVLDVTGAVKPLVSPPAFPNVVHTSAISMIVDTGPAPYTGKILYS